MTSVLYISYTGLCDPLGQSQVLEYLLQLAPKHRITLLTFEKPANLVHAEMTAELKAKCGAAGIQWHRLTYHSRPNIPATLWDIASGTLMGVILAKRTQAEIIHARSYIPGIIAIALKWLTGARFVFDMRGFWPDERVDGGIWTKHSLRYRFFKQVERALLIHADQVVSLTRTGAREILKFKYLMGRMPQIAIIPTCANLQVFRPMPAMQDDEFVLGYVGSVGSWYMFAEIARAVSILLVIDPRAKFLVVNRGSHGAIQNELRKAGVNLDRVEIVSAPFEEVAHQIGRMSAGIFIIKPVFSKKASCPTKMGEFLACGKPILANAGVGDVAEDLKETGTGIALEAFSDDDIRAGLQRLIAIAREPGIAERCRTAAETRFSLKAGVATYDSIYRQLAGPGSVSS